MTSLRFQATIEINGINPFVPVDAEQAARLREGWRKPMPVRVQVNGAPAESWRINMMPRGDGGFFLYLHGEVREAARVGVGDTVDVEVAFDEAYRGGPAHPTPEAFSDGLKRDPAAAKAWEALTPSLQKEALRRFASVKSEEAKMRNIEAALAVLSGAPGRFMARDWKDGAVV
ncbi:MULTISPECIES: YdeI/OmpD-associated family protein [unclassified Caulobacter]|uniref:YdeI/OmpD-associated family protein n=1 Tax=unclassified Caulobacter TaxID=2648921 RepID=UPI0006FB02AB|nr:MULTISPECIES: YdeI/OmpD-associated family protein [unclassified Caulobacter]KQV57490.1 hypothetical protein ASC62_14690 [Caulobacter sp. Root342]KQV67062.1 hypothetical protein ASC70_14790 [Caulobacter sp. Root343]